MTEVVEMKDMEKVPQPTMQSMAKAIQFLTEPKPQRHPKVRSHMESVIEQMINQMN